MGVNMETIHKNQLEEIINLTKKIAQEKIAPQASKFDQADVFPRDALHILGESDLPALVLSESEDGFGGKRVELVAAVREIAKVCASTALVFTSHVVLLKAIDISGNDFLKKKWISDLTKCKSLGAFAVHEPDCGSNAGAISTVAVKDGRDYVVNGSKFFITSGEEANAYLVLVKTESGKGLNGMSTLLIEKNNPGLSFGQAEKKMGLKSTSSKEIFFSNCRIPEKNLIGDEGNGLEILGKSLIEWGFYGAAAISSGLAIAALEKAVRHAKERTIAGQPIGVHQGVQFLISDMVLGSETIETYLNSCASIADDKNDIAAINGFKAKLYASEKAIDVTNKAVQVLGGQGYCRENTVERLFRDARGLTLHFKTSEWLRQDIAKAVLRI